MNRRHVAALLRRGGNISAHGSQDSPVYEILDTEAAPPSIDRLDKSLTINGTTVEASLWYDAANASGTSWNAPDWGGGANLSEAGSGSSPDYDQGSPLLGSSDTSVGYVGAKYHADSGTSDGDVTTEDMVVAALFRKGDASAKAICGKRNASDEGWSLREDATGKVVFRIEDGVGTGANILSAALTSGAWYYIEAYCDRSGSCQLYVNGTASGSAAAVSSVGSLTNSYNFAIGGDSAGGNLYDSQIAFCAMWKGASWLDTHLQADLALARFRALTGWVPQSSTVGDLPPLVFERASNATLEKYNATSSAVEYYTVGANWMRVERWKDGDGEVITGCRMELAGENSIRYSRSFGSWGLGDAGDVIDAADGPWGTGTAWSWVADSTNGSHSISTVCLDIGDPSDPYASKFMIKPGTAPWIRFRNTQMDVSFWVNASTGAVGSSGTLPAETDVDTTTAGGGWWIVSFGGVSNGGAASAYVYLADSDGATTYSGGDGAATDLTIAACQAEAAAMGSLSSWIDVPSTTAVTRVKDEVVNDTTGTGMDGEGAIICDVVQRGAPTATGTFVNSTDYSDASQAAIEHVASDVPRARASTDGSIEGTTDLSDETTRRIGTTWKANQLEVWVNGSLEGTDSSVTAPTPVMTELAIGSTYLGTLQPPVPTLIRRIRLYNRFKANMAALTGGLA